MKYFFFFFFALITSASFSQDDLLNDLMKTQDTTTELLPKKNALDPKDFLGSKRIVEAYFTTDRSEP